MYYKAKSADVVGDVTIGEESSIWYGAVVRGDDEPISVGKRTNVQDCAVLHGAIGFPVNVGDNCTIGHSAIVHGCTVGNNVLIGMGSIVLNGAVIEDDCIIGAGAMVTEGKVIPKGSVVIGVNKILRESTKEEREHNLCNDELYVEHAKAQLEVIE